MIGGSARNRLSLGLGLGLVLELGACSDSETRSSSARAEVELASKSAAGLEGYGYDEALAALDRALAEAESLARTRAGWADHELVAQLRVRRARLSGASADWAAAQQALDAGFAAAPPGGGPILTRLDLDLSLHELARAEALLARANAAPIRTPALELRLAVARGELAAQRGELESAERAFVRAGELGASPAATATRLGLLARRRGDLDDALAKLEQALAQVHSGQGAAWLLVQIAEVEVERGDLEAAGTRLAAAEGQFPGWWQVSKVQAEVLDALGRADEAALLRLERPTPLAHAHPDPLVGVDSPERP